MATCVDKAKVEQDVNYGTDFNLYGRVSVCINTCVNGDATISVPSDIFQKCMEVYGESVTSVKRSFSVAINFKAMSHIRII